MIDFARTRQIPSSAGVRFILVGDAAVTAHGASRLTEDIDIVYARDGGE